MPDVAVAEAVRHSCSFLIRGHGDLKIEWDEAHHAEAVALIQAKMDAGVSFFIVDPTSKAKIKKPIIPMSGTDQAAARQVFVRDADIKQFVESGFGSIASFAGTPELTIKTTGRAKTAAQAASSDTVAVQPSVGG